MRSLTQTGLSIVFLWAVGVFGGLPGARGDDWFVESAVRRNIKATHHSGATGELYFPEINCGGAAWIDYDNDGDLDLYLVQAYELPDGAESAIGNQLFRNDDGKFTDVSAVSGANDRGYGNGVACGDFDNDGLTDIYVTNLGANVLYCNNGDGTFQDVTGRAGVGDPRWSVGAAFVDYDADGDLDLYVANYMQWSVQVRHPCFGRGGRRDYCGPHSFYDSERDTLYQNNGDGTFSNATEAAGIGSVRANGLGVTTGDFNQDGRVDIYVTNDLTENFLWINRGDGTFRDEALMMGCSVNEMGKVEAGMGIAVGDYDGDSDLDLFMVHLLGETNTFYEFDGGMFEDVTARVGLGVPSVPHTGFGTGFFDYDNDGLLDLFVGNGRVSLAPTDGPGGPLAEPNQLFRLTPGGRYEDVSAQAGKAFKVVQTTRGAAFGDFDNDGDTDIALVNMDGPLELLENRIGNLNHWSGIRVQNQDGGNALGAEVTVVAGGKRIHRQAIAAYSYASSNDPRVLVGLDKGARIENVLVRWPDGSREQFGPQESDRYVVLVQGSGRPDGRATALLKD